MNMRGMSDIDKHRDGHTGFLTSGPFPSRGDPTPEPYWPASHWVRESFDGY